MKLPLPPISIDGNNVTRGNTTWTPGTNVKVGKAKGTYQQIFRDRSGGVYMQVVLDGRSHYLPCSTVTKL